jgi:pimeloyl-ACP methyl ester carboxylesterase
MDVVLIPGFWLDATSWEQVTPPLVTAGHRVHPLTLPGLESPDEDRREIGFAHHVSAVVAAVDALPGPVALVGHSGGGTVAGAAADVRPERIAHVIYVDSGPLSDGAAINDALPAEAGEIPLPDWTAFDESELAGLDDELRASFRDRAVPQPARVASDPVTLTDERRWDIPATVISSTMPAALLEELMEKGHPYVAELARVRRRAILELPTGHWPQFTRPQELGEAIVAALANPPR